MNRAERRAVKSDTDISFVAVGVPGKIKLCYRERKDPTKLKCFFETDSENGFIPSAQFAAFFLGDTLDSETPLGTPPVIVEHHPRWLSHPEDPRSPIFTIEDLPSVTKNRPH